MRTIIVEGPDGSGKSTLLGYLSKTLGRSVVHTGGPKTPEELQKAVARVESLAKEVPCLFDRVPQISEQIYAPVDRRPLGMLYFDLMKSLIFMKPIIIYCRLKDQEAMVRRISKKQKPHKPTEWLQKVRENHAEIVERYDALMEDLEGKVPLLLRYDWQRDQKGSLIFKIKELG